MSHFPPHIFFYTFPFPAYQQADSFERYRGYVMMHEGYFYLLDSLPLWLAMSLYAWLWPTRLVPITSSTSLPYVMQPLNDEGKMAAIRSSRSVV